MIVLLKKYKSFLLYGVFGVATTLINVISYLFFYHVAAQTNVVSNVFAWIIAVAFAYITNKIWVFESRSFKKSEVLAEIWKFISCRLATGVLDLLIMYLGVDVAKGSPSVLKVISNIFVILANYVFSKLVIFKKNP